MNTVDYIAIAVILLIVGASVFYIIRAKRRGQKCVGCPYSKECSGKCTCNTPTEDSETKK